MLSDNLYLIDVSLSPSLWSAFHPRSHNFAPITPEVYNRLESTGVAAARYEGFTKVAR